MSQWFQKHRQEYIAACLRTFGQVNRTWIMDRFELSAPQASLDLTAFMAANPNAMHYDGRVKAYVVAKDKLPSPPITADSVRIRLLETLLEEIEEAATSGPIGSKLGKIVGLARKGREV